MDATTRWWWRVAARSERESEREQKERERQSKRRTNQTPVDPWRPEKRGDVPTTYRMILMGGGGWCWPTAALTAGAMLSTAVAVMVVVLFTFQVCGLVQVQSSVGSGDISGLGSVRFNKTGYGPNLVHLRSRFGSVRFQFRLRFRSVLGGSRSRHGQN
ncbi:hypothetical protein HanXRQr2_Chr08g0341931 [Helianthus annuus]|uniref:Uncharacterized protein n=1 Tax=Helianthus annuus TaxID=4232 RepID=A0A9K3IER5_HELAN|nr:hypothetical protein HanXRQr2_Chr08g0341931 [Helianthus annuus]KAJ0553743.1 hypothetical protein HanHA89_Chr08g0299821 [Helianthus annuus]KAJ0553744.1 hypothetical protein HanHA89_Chr08g0299831 [Helianthus annuus]KAJ0722632.1 hypothetical protein HanOQP8_Chr08g0288861 [Helianthus annuus]KAJ0722633.1 hypothetical protein HanOQP8_Chr08g0288871 [Helianthus annuus]